MKKNHAGEKSFETTFQQAMIIYIFALLIQ